MDVYFAYTSGTGNVYKFWDDVFDMVCNNVIYIPTLISNAVSWVGVRGICTPWFLKKKKKPVRNLFPPLYLG